MQPLQDALRNLDVIERECHRDQPPDQFPATAYVVLASPERRWLEVSDGVCKLLGYAREELIGRQIDELAAPEWKPQTPELFEEFVAAGPMDGEFALIQKQGTRVTFDYKARVFSDGAMIAYWYPRR
jgi:PAS domain S-box-containing protein